MCVTFRVFLLPSFSLPNDGNLTQKKKMFPHFSDFHFSEILKIFKNRDFEGFRASRYDFCNKHEVAAVILQSFIRIVPIVNFHFFLLFVETICLNSI